MAAGGFKTFTTGEVLTSADTNNFLMQGVLVFDDATARDAAITAPVEGQVVYLKDTNQVLSFDGSTYVAVGGGSPLTTKGDLYTFSTVDARLPVGTDGFTLVANSSETTGLEWVAPAGAEQNTRFPSTATSHYIATFLSGQDVDAITPTQNVTSYVPIILPTATLDRISIRTAATHTGTSTVRLGIYKAAATNKPGALIIDAGTVSCNATETDFEVTISQAVTAGFYYVAINVQAKTGTSSFLGVANNNAPIQTLFGPSSATNRGVNLVLFRQTGVSGALPNPAATTSFVAADIPGASVRIG